MPSCSRPAATIRVHAGHPTRSDTRRLRPAFGLHLPLSDLILINTVVSLFAGLLPVPGGVGVTEGGISLGLTRAGVPAELAVAIALSYRFAVFYLPPIWAYVCFRWLAARRYL
ncbi:MAG: lysylphosphatidylglycerol synthase domain-containing protein [Candidatus Limnocylindrales bacterium]